MLVHSVQVYLLNLRVILRKKSRFPSNTLVSYMRDIHQFRDGLISG
jgi:hypothetical protein